MAFADLEPHLDPSIVKNKGVFADDDDLGEPLFLWHYRGDATQAKRAFWAGISYRSGWVAVRGDWSGPAPSLEPITVNLREYELVPEERVDELAGFGGNITDVKEVNVPWTFSDMMRECVPQFTLRNLPRQEKFIDSTLPMPFHVDEPVLPEIEEEIESVRQLKVPRPDYVEIWSTPLIDDFRVFLEEVLYLCPWSDMPALREPPGDDSLWSPKLSQASITYQLLDLKDKIFIYSTRGRQPTVFDRTPKRRQARIVNANLPPDESGDGDTEPMG